MIAGRAWIAGSTRSAATRASPWTWSVVRRLTGGRAWSAATAGAGPASRAARSPTAAGARSWRSCDHAALTARPRGRAQAARYYRPVPYLRLIELGTHNATDVREEVARLGRSPDCTVVPAGGGAQLGVVSAFHAELRHGPAGWQLNDLGSRNGTFLNGRRLAAEAVVKAGDVSGPIPIRLGDRLMLGQGGPVLIVEGLGTSPQLQAARRQARPGPRTLRAMIGEAIAKAKRRLAAFVALLILVLGAGVYGVYWLL